MNYGTNEDIHKRLNVCIIDDEERACLNLSNMLIEYVEPPINILGIFTSTEDAEKQLSILKPDAVFLDIEMPHENAFRFLDRISPFNFEVIFVTAYDEFALNAFRLNAIDYILKPISIKELQSAVQKLHQKKKYDRFNLLNPVSYQSVSNQITEKVKQDKLLLRDTNAVEIVKFDKIIYIEAQGNYSKVVFYTDKAIKWMVVCTFLSEFEELLPAENFFRIHRSFTINLQQVQKIKTDTNEAVLKSGNTLPISRRRYASLMTALKLKNSGKQDRT